MSLNEFNAGNEESSLPSGPERAEASIAHIAALMDQEWDTVLIGRGLSREDITPPGTTFVDLHKAVLVAAGPELLDVPARILRAKIHEVLGRMFDALAKQRRDDTAIDLSILEITVSPNQSVRVRETKQIGGHIVNLLAQLRTVLSHPNAPSAQ